MPENDFQIPTGFEKIGHPSLTKNFSNVSSDPTNTFLFGRPNAPAQPEVQAPVQQATLTSKTGEKRVVDVGSQEATDLFTAGYTLGDKVGGGTVIEENTIKAQPEISIGDGTPEPTGADADTFVGGLTESQKQTAENLKNAERPESEQDQTLADLMAQVTGEIGAAESAESLQLKAEEEQGIADKNQIIAAKNTELRVKLAEIQALTNSFNEGATKIEGLNILTSGISGKKGQLHREFLARKNSLASEAGLIQAELLGMQGELTAAQNAADRAVALKFADQQFNINSKIQMIDLLLPQISSDNKEYAEAYKLTLEQQATATAEEKAIVTSIQNIKLQAITSGITNPNVLSQIGNATTIDAALQIMGENMPQEQTKQDFQVIGEDEYGNKQYGFVDETTGIVTPFTPGQAGVVTDASGSSYDILSYATDPNHENAVQNILNNIGQMTSVEDMDNYIQQVAPGSPVTGQMIANASEQFGVSWETQMAIMQQDSSFGTAGAGARSFNPGNVGNTETATSTGQLVNFGDWQSGVNAVARNLAGRKVVGQPGQAEGGTYPNNYEFSYNEKVDTTRLPKIGGKPITNKSARTANLPFGITDKQVDWIQLRRPGNIEFQKLKVRDYDTLIGIFELKDDLDEIKELKEKVNTGFISAIDKRIKRFTGREGKKINSFTALEVKTGKELANYIKTLSGTAASDKEVQRLGRNIPNVSMQDEQFLIALDDYEDDINAVLRGKLSQYDFEDEFEFRKAITGADIQEMDDGSVWMQQADGTFKLLN